MAINPTMIDTPTYTGPDRRHFHRREKSDRRAMIRFEPDKDNRRSGTERRAQVSVWDDRHGF